MPSILVVDDDPQIRKLLHRILGDCGHAVHEAANGIEAIRKYGEQRPDLVITDIVMPEKEGLETVMALKRINPGVKIIAISGGGSIGTVDYLSMAKMLGAKQTLGKPIMKEELINAVNDLLSGS